MADTSSTEATASRREQRSVRDAYGIALCLVLGSVLMLIAVDSPVASWLALVAGMFMVAALVVTLRVSGVGQRAATLGGVIGVLLLVGGAAAVILGGADGRLPALIAWAVLTLATIAAIGRRLRSYQSVTIQLVMGLLVIYVLLGVSFGLAYELVEAVAPPAFAQGEQGISGSLYFSFITLATVGFGDVSPGNDVVRALSVAEAIIGQLYLVSVVSLAVSRLRMNRREQQD